MGQIVGWTRDGRLQDWGRLDDIVRKTPTTTYNSEIRKVDNDDGIFLKRLDCTNSYIYANRKYNRINLANGIPHLIILVGISGIRPKFLSELFIYFYAYLANSSKLSRFMPYQWVIHSLYTKVGEYFVENQESVISQIVAENTWRNWNNEVSYAEICICSVIWARIVRYILFISSYHEGEENSRYVI